MYDTKKIILIWSVFLIVIAAILVCILPWASKAPQTLTAVALDSQHQEVGTVTISMDGKQKDYLFRTDRLHIDIEDFHHYQRFQAVQNGNTNVYGRIYTAPSGEVFYANYSALDTQLENYVFFTIAFSKDMTRWAFIPHHSETYYVASVDNSCTTEELVDFFQGFIPPSTDGTLDWNMEGYHVAQDGTITETISFTLAGKVTNSKDGSAKLTVEIDLPDDFPYQIQVNDFYCHSQDIVYFQYYVVNSLCFDQESFKDKIVKIALDINKGYAAFIWPDESVLFASVSRETGSEEIIQHFQNFLRAYELSIPVTPPDPPVAIHWNLNATYLTEDGEILDSFPLAVEVNIEKNEYSNGLLTLQLAFPEDFPYSNFNQPLVFESLTDDLTDVDYYICDTDYIFYHSAPRLVQLVLCEKMEYLLFYWPKDPGKYLVASQDADVPAEDILSYFDYYLNEYTPQPKITEYSQRVYCKVVSTDWRDGKVFPGTFHATVTDHVEQADTIALTLTHYGDYYYSAPFPDDSCELTNEILNLPYLTYHGWGYDRGSDSFITAWYAYDPETQYFIAMWESDPNNILVASLDKETEAETILAHFQEFIERYGRDS